MVGVNFETTTHHCRSRSPSKTSTAGSSRITSSLDNDDPQNLTAENLGFKSAKHEPCLYQGAIDGTTVFMLRQVDDFAAAAPSVELANKNFILFNEALNNH